MIASTENKEGKLGHQGSKHLSTTLTVSSLSSPYKKISNASVSSIEASSSTRGELFSIISTDQGSSDYEYSFGDKSHGHHLHYSPGSGQQQQPSHKTAVTSATYSGKKSSSGRKSSQVAPDLSDLVNYVQAVKFRGLFFDSVTGLITSRPPTQQQSQSVSSSQSDNKRQQGKVVGSSASSSLPQAKKSSGSGKKVSGSIVASSTSGVIQSSSASTVVSGDTTPASASTVTTQVSTCIPSSFLPPVSLSSEQQELDSQAVSFQSPLVLPASFLPSSSDFSLEDNQPGVEGHPNITSGTLSMIPETTVKSVTSGSTSSTSASPPQATPSENQRQDLTLVSREHPYFHTGINLLGTISSAEATSWNTFIPCTSSATPPLATNVLPTQHQQPQSSSGSTALGLQEEGTTIASSTVTETKSSRSSQKYANPLAPCYQVPSLNEQTAKKLCRKSPSPVISFTESQLMRSYPSGMRIDSSNFNPLTFWAFGLQMVAINYQTDDMGSAINTAFFEQNGSCGLVKKPAVMIDSNHVMYGRFNPWEKEFDGLYALDLTITVTFFIMSYVTLCVFGLIFRFFSYSPSLPP